MKNIDAAIAILKPYLERDTFGGMRRIVKPVPHAVYVEALGAIGNPDDQHNSAPPSSEIVANPGSFPFVGGYVILPERNDARVSVDTVYVEVPSDPVEAAFLGHELGPDSLSVEVINGKTYLEAWWD